MVITATMSGAEFDALPYEEGRLWELLDGEQIPMPSPTILHQRTGHRILNAFEAHLESAHACCGCDVEFALNPNTRVRPDVWVLLGAKAQVDENESTISGSPDIVVEVISPSERTIDSMRKVETYLKHGASEVWQVYPDSRQVVVHSAPKGLRKFSLEDTITSTVLPGFELPVSTIF